MESKSAFAKFISRFSNIKTKIYESWKLKYRSGHDTFQFLLTLRGLEIYTANSGKKFMTADNEVRQGSSK